MFKIIMTQILINNEIIEGPLRLVNLRVTSWLADNY